MVEQFAVRHLAPEHAHCMQRYSAQQQQCLLQGITTKITMEHNVITHPGGERVRKGLQRCLPNRLRVSLFSTSLLLLFVSFCSCCCYCYFLNLFRIVNSIILTFYCIFIAFVTSLNVFMTLLCRFLLPQLWVAFFICI